MSKNYVCLHSDLFLHIRTYLSGNTKVFEVFLPRHFLESTFYLENLNEENGLLDWF